MKTLLILIFAFSLPALADITVIQPGATEGKDSFVHDGLPTNNFGSNVNVRVAGLTANPRFVSFIKFVKLNNYIGQSHTVTTATLSLLARMNTGSGTLNAYLVTSSWGESTITWNNQPSVGSTPIATIAYPGTNTWIDFDITDTVQDWVDGTTANNGIAIFGGSGETYTVHFHSSDTTLLPDAPKLTLDSTIGIESGTLGKIKATFK